METSHPWMGFDPGFEIIYTTLSPVDPPTPQLGYFYFSYFGPYSAIFIFIGEMSS